MPHTVEIFIKVFPYILKSVETFLIQSYCYSNAKNTNKTKKNRTSFDLTRNS